MVTPSTALLPLRNRNAIQSLISAVQRVQKYKLVNTLAPACTVQVMLVMREKNNVINKELKKDIKVLTEKEESATGHS